MYNTDYPRRSHRTTPPTPLEVTELHRLPPLEVTELELHRLPPSKSQKCTPTTPPRSHRTTPTTPPPLEVTEVHRLAPLEVTELHRLPPSKKFFCTPRHEILGTRLGTGAVNEDLTIRPGPRINNHGCGEQVSPISKGIRSRTPTARCARPCLCPCFVHANSKTHEMSMFYYVGDWTLPT